MTTLKSFLDTELSFSAKTYFRLTFCNQIVQEDVLIKYFHQLVTRCSQFCVGRSVSAPLLLVLSRTCHDLHTRTTVHLVTTLADMYNMEPVNMAQVNTRIAAVSQSLLDSYVKLQAGDLSLMIRKSVEARDWLSTVEPRSVRAVMKRVVEDVSLIDNQVKVTK